VLGLSRVKTITFLDWRDTSNQANMQQVASEFLDTVKDIVFEGSLTYDGLLTNLLTFGSSLNIAGNGYPTGLETLAAPILSVGLQFNEGRDGATSYSMGIQFSNRRAPFSGQALFRPASAGQPLGFPEAVLDAQGHAGLPDLAGQYGGWKMGEEGPEYQQGALQQSIAGTLGQSGGALGRVGGSPLGAAAAQSASAGMGDPVTSMASPQEALAGVAEQAANAGMGAPVTSVSSPQEDMGA
jgi:hypothetical protein